MIPDNLFDKLDNLLKPRVMIVDGKEWQVGVQTLYLPRQYTKIVHKYYPHKFRISVCQHSPSSVAITKRK